MISRYICGNIGGAVYIELYTYKLTNVSSLRPPHRAKLPNEARPKSWPHLRITFEVISPTGAPKEPKTAADVFIKQCGVLVRDHVPISVREWNKRKGKNDSYVAERYKGGIGRAHV